MSGSINQSGNRPTIEIQKSMAGNRSAASKYRELVIGRSGWWALIRHELIHLVCQNTPGALGLWLRSRLYPVLLKKCGCNVVFGQHVLLRHPHRIEIGDGVVIDDHVLLDAKGEEGAGIRIGDGVFIGRNTILSCKNGRIELGSECNIGFNCEIVSAAEVILGPRVLMAAYTYLIGADHDVQSAGTSVLEQGRRAFGIRVGEGSWFGAGVKVLDGVAIGSHSIVGAGAVVNRDIGDRKVAVGIPARVVRDRSDGKPL